MTLRRPISSLTLSFLLIGLSSFADTTVKVQHTEANKAPSPQTVYVSNGKVRMEQPGRDNTLLIYHQATNTFFAIQPSKQSYMELDPEKVSAMMGQADQMREQMMAQLEERMAGMSEAEREQMRQMMSRMGQPMPGAEPEPIRYESRSDGASAGGFSCRWVDAFRGSKKVRELCVASWSDIDFDSADRETMMAMRKAMTAIASRFGDANMFADEPDGFPAHIRHFNEGGAVSSEQKLESVSSEAVDQDLFVVPAGYKRQELPQMPQR